MKKPVAIAVSLLALGLAAAAARAEDWPEFRGANRQGKSAETGLLKQWPAGGPPLLWSKEGFGQGYSSATVAGGRVFLTGMLDGQKGHLFALDLEGKELWRVEYGPETLGEGYPGARCSPTVDGERLYITSGTGLLACYEAATGKKVWSIDLLKEFAVDNPRWGISENVLVDGDHLIVCPGGRRGMVAIDKKTGKTVWAALGIDRPTSYTSPVLMEREGRTVVIGVFIGAIAGVDRADGTLLWTHPFTQQYGVLCVSPVIEGDLAFTAAGYTGAVVLEVSKDGKSAKPVWEKEAIDTTHGGAVEVDGYIYGTSSRFPKEEWVCVEMKTGEVKWHEKGVGKGCVIYADGMLYCYGEKSGKLALVRPSPERLDTAGEITIEKGESWHWAHPSISDGRLYVRHGGALMCFDIKAK